MNKATAERLARVMKFNGTAILEDRESLQRLLAPGAATVPDDIEALLILLDTKAVAHLIKWASADMPNKPSFEQMRDHMAKKFAQSGKLSEEMARWGLDAWKAALPSLQQAARPPVAAMTLEPIAEPPAPEAAVPAVVGAPGASRAGSATRSAASRDNPYAPPQSNVADVEEPRLTTFDFIDNGRGVSAGQGLQWIVEGWRLFTQQPFMWWLVIIIFFLVTLLIQVVPLVGPLISLFLGPLFTAGLMLGAHSVKEGGRVSPGHVFAGFSERPGELLLLAIFQLLAGAALFGLFFVLFSGTLMAAGAQLMMGAKPSPGMVGSLLLPIILGVLLAVPLFWASYQAPAAVAVGGVSAFQAYKSALIAFFKNILPLLVNFVMFMLLAVLASVPFFLGWIVLLPVSILSIYAAYRDIFHDERVIAVPADDSGAPPPAPKRLARTLPPVSRKPVPPLAR